MLNKIEMQEYEEKVICKIPNVERGRIYYFRDFFYPLGCSTPPRLARKFREDIIDGKFANLKLVSPLLRDGFYLESY